MHIKYCLPLLACVSTLSAASPIDLQGRASASESSSFKRAPLNSAVGKVAGIGGVVGMEAGTVALLAYLWKHSNDGPRSRDLSLSPDLAGFENKRDKEEFTSLSVRDPLNAVGAKVGTLFAEGALGAAGLGALAYGSYQSLKKAKAKLDQLQQRDLPSPNGVKLDDDELWAYQKSLATGKKLENIWEKTKSL